VGPKRGFVLGGGGVGEERRCQFAFDPERSNNKLRQEQQQQQQQQQWQEQEQEQAQQAQHHLPPRQMRK
jgi:hypothetical protein